MEEVYITLEEAARLEWLSYTGMVSKINRNPESFSVQSKEREMGGHPQVLIAASSLSAKAQRAYKAAQRVAAMEVDEEAGEAVPWYVEVDLNHYIEAHRRQYYQAVELANRLREFMAYDDRNKTLLAARLAKSLGISQRTLYRQTEALIEAQEWADRMEWTDGMNRDYFGALSLCRKPRETDNFPSLSPEQKAYIAAVWFDKGFSANLGTMEMLYEAFEAEAVKQDWHAYPSIKTVARFIHHLMSLKGAERAKYLSANGSRAWKNKMMLKAKRDATTMEVMEYVVGDVHTFDVWVQYTAPNGKVKAIRPQLAAWEDMRSRCIIGDVICEHSNGQVLKESLIKLIYSQMGGVPKALHIDNGKDYTGQPMTGQSRKERRIDFQPDSETQGFYQSIGIQEVSRSKPYQPWDKPIERTFRTVCEKFSKWFASYTGTLTGSKTYAKRQKDVGRMLERGELMTMEEFFTVWSDWKENKYHAREHRGLKEAGEKWSTPAQVFENAPRYEKAAPPMEYAAMLLMKADKALVTNQGITKFGTLYADYELCYHVGKHVGVKWDMDDVTKLYVFDQEGAKICEAVSAELLQFGSRVSQTALETHMRNQKRQEKEARAFSEDIAKPYERLLEEGRAAGVVGKLELMVKAERPPKIIALPQDKEYLGEVKSGKRKRTDNGFLNDQADKALSRIRAIQ